MTIEKVKFVLAPPDIGIIAATATGHINLEAIKTEFGHNFNTLHIKNNSSVELSYSLDGRTVGYIDSGDGISFDWEAGIVWDDLQITNQDAAVATAANEIRITVGRTGVK